MAGSLSFVMKAIPTRSGGIMNNWVIFDARSAQLGCPSKCANLDGALAFLSLNGMKGMTVRRTMWEITGQGDVTTFL
jgi:hypothetical protein